MPFIEAPTTFYLGRRYDPTAQQLADEVVYYDSRDLTTHAIVVGMTGSGKTGMCITLLEEAALDNIPAIVIDPKGDITNLLLLFPELRPQDFAPWINPSDAQRAGLSIEEFAQDVAQTWREGLSRWSIVPQRIAALKNAARFSIYTPGSDAGLPVSILASLRAPRLGWVGNEEFYREQISGIVTALMALIGRQVAPVKDREHVLIANIFEEAWKNGRDLTLEDIILQVQNPPFSRLGVFDVNTFFPERERFKLAKELNHIIAAPSFQTWISGEPMDVRNLLYTREGRPRVSIFYLAHLTEAEQSFMITLILESMLAWMRSLSGTTSLRAILYFDEVFGHIPPAPRNPPTKEPLLRLIKQARAFGIGMVLATQNPGDLDYKSLSNAGTWFIGKLQTENDKRRVLTGLESAATAESQFDIRTLDRLISGLAPRVFVVHNVHDGSGPYLLHSRWAMSYLRGPLTRQQVRSLMEEQRQMLGLDAAPIAAPSATSGMPPAPPAQSFAGGMTGMTGMTPIPSGFTPSQPVPPAVSQPVSQPVSPPAPPPVAPPPHLPEVPAARLSRESAGAVDRPPLPGESAAPPGFGSTTAPLPESLPEAPPPSGAPAQAPVGSFLDRLRSQPAEPPTPPADAADESAAGLHQPTNPFRLRPPSQTPPPTTPTAPEAPPSSGAFWTTPQPDDVPLPRPVPQTPPSAGMEGLTAPVGMPYTPANPPGSATVPGPSLPEGYASRPPILPPGIAQFFLPTTLTVQQAIRKWEQQYGFSASAFGGAQLLYKPVLLAQLTVRYLDRKSGVEGDQAWAFHVPNVEAAGFVRWSEYQTAAIEPSQLSTEPFGEAAYGVPSAGLTDARRMRALRDDVVDFVARSATLSLFYNSTLGLYGQPGEERRDFLARAAQLAREARDREIDETTDRYDKQLNALDQRLRRLIRESTADREVLDELRREDLYTTGEAALSLLRGRTTYTLSRMSRARRFKKQAQERKLANEAEIADLEDQIEAKQQELQQALRQLNEKWARIANSVEEYRIKPFKKDIALEVFGIGWIPVWFVVLNGQPAMLPAFTVG